MERAALVLAFVATATMATAYECEKSVETAAMMAVEKHEGGLSVVDHCTAFRTLYSRNHHAIIWLQARYMEEDRRPTQWCVIIDVPTGCTDELFKFSAPIPKARKVVSCTTIPDDEGIRRLLKSVGWTK